MIDLTKTVKPELIEKNIADAVEKSKSFATKAVDFNNIIFKESLKFFNEVTDKYFQTYTVKASEAADKSTEYAKEFIQTGSIKAFSTNSFKN